VVTSVGSDSGKITVVKLDTNESVGVELAGVTEPDLTDLLDRDPGGTDTIDVAVSGGKDEDMLRAEDTGTGTGLGETPYAAVSAQDRASTALDAPQFQ
jgi:hypothetical protein